MNTRRLLQSFHEWRAQKRDLVLATVYETAGSTYSKAGAQMLIDDEGNFQGMLSGGCLEGDLAARAAAVLKSGLPQSVTFDLGGSDDGLWGLGVGCDGVMRVFLQPLDAANSYEPFASVASILAGDAPGVLATVIGTGGESLAGATLAQHANLTQSNGMPAALQQQLQQCIAEVLETKKTAMFQASLAGAALDVLVALVEPPPRVLVLGGGLDAQPMVRLIAELGWRVTLQDHRPAYIQKGDFSEALQILSVPAAELATHVELSTFDAAIVMSHHLATDRIYLELLADTSIGYIGLLGPPSRRERLLQDLADRERLSGRVHGPAGLDIGGRGPASIAVSIVAEMHQQLMRRAADR
ncbi:MAG: XdhC family protein [Woeseia sp.]